MRNRRVFHGSTEQLLTSRPVKNKQPRFYDFSIIISRISNRTRDQRQSYRKRTMTASTATYKELETFNNACSQDGEGSGGRRLRFKWPGVGIVVLSITTLIFGLQALHLFLRPPMGCPSQALGGGFSTEWGRDFHRSKSCRC